MRRLLLLVVFALGACSVSAYSPEPTIPAFAGPPGPASGSRWVYGTGPHGENCLFYGYDAGYNGHSGSIQGWAMSCDTVKP